MGEAVLARVVAHIASLGTQPASGDVDAADFCRAMREPAPRRERPWRPSSTALRRVHPQVLHGRRPRVSRLHPGWRRVPRGACRPDRRRHEPLHRRLDGGAGAGTAGGERPRLVPRLDGLPADGARPAHDGRVDGELQRHRLCARTSPRGRHPARSAVHVHAGPPSVLKSARLAGIMPDRVREIDVDGDFRLRTDLLHAPSRTTGGAASSPSSSCRRPGRPTRAR